MVDSSQGILSAFRYTFEKLQLSVPSDKELSTFIGPPSHTGLGLSARTCGRLHLGHLFTMTKRVAAFPTTAIGLFGLVSGVLSLLCHVALNPLSHCSCATGPCSQCLPGPAGGVLFHVGQGAQALGDARHIGILSYITPLASTALLLVVSGRPFSWSIAVATAMIIGAAVIGMRAR